MKKKNINNLLTDAINENKEKNNEEQINKNIENSDIGNITLKDIE